MPRTKSGSTRCHSDSLKLTDYAVLVPITVQVQHHDITFISSEAVERATLQILGQVMTSSGRVADIFEDTVKVQYPAGSRPRIRSTTYQKFIALAPGEYWLDLVIKDVSGDKVGSQHHRFAVLETGIAH